MKHVVWNIGMLDSDDILFLSFNINKLGKPENLTAYQSQNDEINKISIRLIPI